MSVSIEKPIISLSENGDSLVIIYQRRLAAPNDPIHQDLKQASHCRTHQAVFDFLNGIKNNLPARESASFWHENNPNYSGHWFGWDLTHPESVEDMIKFVDMKIKESLPNVEDATKIRAKKHKYCIIL